MRWNNIYMYYTRYYIIYIHKDVNCKWKKIIYWEILHCLFHLNLIIITSCHGGMTTKRTICLYKVWSNLAFQSINDFADEVFKVIPHFNTFLPHISISTFNLELIQMINLIITEVYMQIYTNNVDIECELWLNNKIYKRYAVETVFTFLLH